MLWKLIVSGRSEGRADTSPLSPPSDTIGRRYDDAANRLDRGGACRSRPRQRVRNTPAALPSAAGAISLSAVSGRLHPHQVSFGRYSPEAVWVKLKTGLASGVRSSRVLRS